jgi:TatA/E family protein of Tat protein translocase
MFNIGPLELMVILLLALVVVGPSRLPEVGRSIGRALREFRKVQDEVRDSINFNLDPDPVTPRVPTKPGPPPAAVERARAAAAAETQPQGDAQPETQPTAEPKTQPETQPEAPQETTAPLVGEAMPGEPPAPGSPNGSTPTPEPSPE